MSKVVTIAAAHSVHDTYAAFLPPLLPVFIEKLSLARAEAGLLVVCFQGPSLLQPVIGHLGDRLDLRLAVILSPALTAVCMSLLGGTADWMGMRWTFQACALLALLGTPFIIWMPGRSGRVSDSSTD